MNKERRIIPDNIPMNRRYQADKLRLDIDRLEKEDPNDGTTFALKYFLSTELAKIEGKSKLDIIKTEKEEAFKRPWTPQASEKMVFLSTEKQIEENRHINPDVANILACSIETKRISPIATSLLKEGEKNKNIITLIKAERMFAVIDSLIFRQKLLTTKVIEQSSQKPSSVTGK